MAATRTCYLHVGLPKTGTSYLQSVLDRSRDALARQGMTVLPTSTTPFSVMLDVRGKLRPEYDEPEAFEALDRLTADAAALPAGARAVLSQELFALCSPEEAGALLAALAGYEVHLVVTVRDLATQLPSLWQQQVKARGVTPFAAFVERVTSDAWDDVTGFDLLGVLEQWRDHVPAERVHVVTVPRSGGAPDLLLERFCQVLGVETAPLDTSRVRANQSIGLVQAELLRRVNVALGQRLPHARAGYRGPGKRFLAETILIKQDGQPPRLPASARPWVEQRSQLLVDTLRSGEYDVVGDLSDLVPDGSAFSDDLDEVTDAELVEAATRALADVLVDRHEGKAKRAGMRRTISEQRQRIGHLESGALRRLLGRVRRHD